MHRILVINPGSTSTEISVFQDEREVHNARISHPVDELRKFARVIQQLPYRQQIIESKLAELGIKKGDLEAVVGRSSLSGRKSGTYTINNKMIEDVKQAMEHVEHPASLGCMLAHNIATLYAVPAYVSHIAMTPLRKIAAVSGIPEIERKPAYHVENIHGVAMLAASKMTKDLHQVNLIVAHLEGGMSIAAFRKGKLVDVTSAFDEGPFTTERSGSLPGVPLVNMCFSGKFTRGQVLKKIRGEGGMVAYLGTNKLGEVEERVNNGDKKAAFYLEAMCYQASKDIGTMATVLKGKVDAIILTGKLLESKRAVKWITERVKFIAPVKKYHEQEMIAAARAGLRIVTRTEKLIEYQSNRMP